MILMHNSYMRTTIAIDDDVHEFAMVYARARGLTLGAAINELLKKAEKAAPKAEIRHSQDGFPLLPKPGKTITSEMVKELSEDDIG
jgi:hypothetical protein